MAQISPPTSVPAPVHFVNENRAPRDDDGSRSHFARPEPALQVPKPTTESPNPYGRPSTNVVETAHEAPFHGQTRPTECRNLLRTLHSRMQVDITFSRNLALECPIQIVQMGRVLTSDRVKLPMEEGAKMWTWKVCTKERHQDGSSELESRRCRDSVKCLLAAVLHAGVVRHYVAIDLGTYKNRRVMTSRAPSKRTCTIFAPLPTTDRSNPTYGTILPN
ncbi:hypothetical protein ACEPAI_9663 [Sanghuangporus weigelae]